MSNKVTLKDIVKEANVRETLLTLIKLYPDQSEMIDNYAKVFEYLLNAEPDKNEEGLYIVITEEYGSCMECANCIANDTKNCTNKDSNKYYNVSGWYDNGENTYYGIEFNTWDVWLGAYIKEDTISKFTKEEIVAHCMWEMTFVSFDQEKIKQKIEDLHQIIQDIDNGTAKLIPWEEVCKELEAIDAPEEG